MARKKGSKLSRTEIFNVRFDPKLKMAAELLAARERRTLSSLTEWVMERAVKEMAVTKNTDGQPVTAWEVADKCWQPEHIWRIYFLSQQYPELLSHVERKFSVLAEFLKNFETHLSGDKTAFLWSAVAPMVEDYIMAWAEGKITQPEMNKHYQEARIELLAITYKSANEQLRELADSGTLDQYPKAKEMILRLIGIQ